MHILVTGGAGFVGTNLIKQLLSYLQFFTEHRDCFICVLFFSDSINSDFSIDYPLINPTNQNQLPSQFYRVISQ